MCIVSLLFRNLVGNLSVTRSKDANNRAPPPCTKTDLNAQSQETLIDHDKNVAKLQRLITWRIAVDYMMKSRVPRAERPESSDYSRFTHLCKKYCMLLGMQFDSQEEITKCKEEIMREILEPAKALHIPSDCMEFFMYSVRAAIRIPLCWSRNIISFSNGLTLTRIILDQRIMIDAMVRNTALAQEFKARCCQVHQQDFFWMLGPGLINLDGMEYEIEPSFLRDGELSHWPNVAQMIDQSRRPCTALMPSAASDSYRVYYKHFHYRRVGQPEVYPAYAPESPWVSKLPGDILCWSDSWPNPDGRAPKLLPLNNGYF